MKILIVNNMAPFLWGGAEELAVNLEKQLLLAGHQAEILRIPFQWEPYTKIPTQMLMAQSLELYNVDRVIALKFPAYLINHSHKTFWLLHQYRQAYDLFDAGQSNIPSNTDGEQLREIIKKADNNAFNSAKHVFTNSPVTTQRLRHYNDIDSEVLYPPINDPELFTGGESEGYIFAGGRVNGMKRQHLLVEAMQFTDSKVKLIIAGPPDTMEDRERLERLVEKYNLSDRVSLDLNFLPRTKIANYANQALACAYLPFDEDSLGYVAMEAANARKPLITATDSGGILGLVENNVTGWVVEPQPDLLAESMNMIFAKQQEALKKGEAMYNHWKKLNITWGKTIEKLLA